MPDRRFCLIVALAASIPLATPARAETVDIQYALTLAGLSIGTATLSGSVGRDSYKIDVKARMTGLAGMVTSGRGAGSSSGSTASGRVVPSSYALTSGGTGKVYTVRMALTGGAVSAVEIMPPLEGKVDRVPLTEGHKRNIVDPVSALVMPVTGQGLLDPASCSRTIPVFDGAGRFDVLLSYSATRSVDLPGYSGPVLVCAARYNPIAGHRTNRPSTQFMADNRDMEVWLVPVEGARTLLPARIAVRTMVGMTIIEATAFNVRRASADPATTSSTTTVDARRN
jgi:hypothetical protein